MAEVKKYIAVDLGAESGRVMIGSVCRGHPVRQAQGGTPATRLVLEEIHRFGNGPVDQAGSLRWDFDRLLSEIRTGIAKAARAAGAQVWGIGIDSWGVDFGLLDADGKLIENPYHYRDSQTNGMMDEAFKLMSSPRTNSDDLSRTGPLRKGSTIPTGIAPPDPAELVQGKRDIYQNTGIQFMQLNSLYQLLAMRVNNSVALAKAKNLVFVADLFSYFLCGKIFAEYTLASTSQFMDMRTSQWSKEVLDKLSLPIEIMPKVVPPGTVVGQLTGPIGRELGCGPVPVIAIGSHDTASAVVAVPASPGTNWAYLSSGTWSLMGVEVPQAIVNDKTFEYSFTNEGGVENTIRLLKNIMGLWLMQECRRQWQREGTDLSYTEMAAMARQAKPFARHIDVDCSDFLAPGDMPKRINEHLTATGQKPVRDKGQMIRVILESLALKYRRVCEALEDAIGHNIDILHIVGGGMQNELLCEFTANALGKKVVTGPVEATASGNILMQAIATRQIKTLAEARQIVRNSFKLKEYEPQDTALWQKQYEKCKK